jgi:hypothetical protein
MDTIHSYHAPYVDIFRADRYMAQHILRQKTIGNTIVAPSLVDLPEIIEKFQ